MEELIEADNWKIFFERDYSFGLEEGWIKPVFRLKEGNHTKKQIDEEALEKLKRDLRDLGKWRKFRELKRDLENEPK